MSELNDAVNALKQQARNAKAVIMVGEALEKIQNLEQHQKECEARTAIAKKEADEACRRLAEANGAVRVAEEKAKGLLDDANSLADKTIELAKAAGAEVQAKAAADAQRVAHEARAYKAGLESACESLRAEKAALASQIEDQRAKLAALKEEKAKLLAKLA